jgi:hypothetical protein
MTIEELLPLLVPLVILQLILIGLALYDMTRPGRRVRGGNRLLWGIAVCVFGLFGPLAYFLFGREDV